MSGDQTSGGVDGKRGASHGSCDDHRRVSPKCSKSPRGATRRVCRRNRLDL